MLRPITVLALLAVLACSGGGPSRLPGYSKPFQLEGGFAVGVAGAQGVRWERQAVGEHYEGVVIATWCPTCEAMLADRERDPRLRAATANLFYVDTELRRDVERAQERGELSAEEGRAVLLDSEAAGQLVTYPERLVGLGARAVRIDEVPAEWFPFFFTCDGSQCEGWAGAF